LIDQRDSPAQVVLRSVERFRPLGYRETQHGVRLFGPAPHIARQAWFHAIPPGLSASAVAELSRGVDVEFPDEYRRFLEQINGAHLFSGELALYGARPTAAGRSVDSAFLPFDLTEANLEDKPNKLRRELLVIGSYKYDGSIVALDIVKRAVERWDGNGEHRHNVWPSFGLFISTEMIRLDALYDDQAKYVAVREADVVPQMEC
jgi:hypothetical protein